MFFPLSFFSPQLSHRLRHGGLDLKVFRECQNMGKKEFQAQLRSSLQVKTTRREINTLFEYFDHDKSQTLGKSSLKSFKKKF